MGGIALIVGTVGTMITMALHPTGGDLFEPGQLESATNMFINAHALAIGSLPVLFLGALGLSRRLAAPDRLAIAALVLYGLALAAAMVAAVVSGFVAPDLARRELIATGSEADGWQIVFHYNGLLNQAFAGVLVLASSVAIVLWSAAIVRSRVLARGIGFYGVVSGPVIIIALVSGHLTLDIHGFGLVVLVQAVWFIVVGSLLCRRS